MPFGFGRKKDEPPAESGAEEVAAADRRAPRSVRFHGLTDEWQIRGSMTITGRLLDTLNRREAIGLSDVHWAPIDGSAPFDPAPGIRTVDPYDLIVVIAGPETLATDDEEERTAHRVHKIPFDVALEAPPLRVLGTVLLYPGSEPGDLLQRSTQMFVAVTRPSLWVGGTQIGLDADADVALVNRSYLRGVDQVDLATGEAPQRLPGIPLGGTNWRERT